MDQTKSGKVGKDPYGSYPSGSDPTGGDPADRDPADRDQSGSYLAEQASAVGSIWQLKPWWCQPWSILITGGAIIAISWLGLHRLWITAPLSCAVLLWWWLFLWVVPASYRLQIESERPSR